MVLEGAAIAFTGIIGFTSPLHERPAVLQPLLQALLQAVLKAVTQRLLQDVL